MKLKILISLLFVVSNIQAAVPYDYGAGSRASAMGNAYITVKGDTNSQFYNPASLDFDYKSFSYSGVDSKDKLKAPGEIKIDNGSTRNIDKIDYPNAFGSTFTLSFPLSSRLNFGMLLYLPYQNLLEFSSDDPFAPQYVMYVSRDGRPFINPNLTYNITKSFSFGMGVIIAYNITATTTVYVDPSDSQKPSYSTLSIKTKPVPYAVYGGILEILELFSSGDNYLLNAGFVYREEAVYRTRFVTNSNLDIISSTNLQFNAVMSGVPYYDPETYTGGLSFGRKGFYLIALNVSYEKWSKYQSSAIKLEGDFINILPDLNFKDRTVYKAGGELDLRYFGLPVSLRAGYDYVPSPVPAQTGNGNLLDCDKQIYSAGLGTTIPQTWLPINYPFNLDFHYQYHKLKDRLILKGSSDNIGYRDGGYVAGGNIQSWGVTGGVVF